MATNKRKDAAALFELLDKSTLKVPKSAGALKIPEWWSSKTNPPGTTSAAPATPVSKSAPPAAQAPAAPRSTSGARNSRSPATPADAPQRLYQPPAPSASPVSPSIRPPSTTGSAPAMPEAPAATPLFNSPPSAPTSSPAIPSASGGTDSPATSSPSATPRPATTGVSKPAASSAMGTSRTSVKSDVSGTPKTAVTETPAQAAAREKIVAAGKKATLTPRRRPLPAGLILGAAGIFIGIVVLCLLPFMLRKSHSSTNTVPLTGTGSTDSGSELSTNNGGEGSLLPRANTGSGQTTPRVSTPPTKETSAGQNSDLVTNDSPAKWYKPGEVQRSKDLYYIIIASTPSADIAERNATQIAKDGVSVSIETRNAEGSRTLYTLVSADGFPTIAAAEPLRKRIVEIGHQMPEFKKQRKVWDDAYVRKVTSLSH